MNNEAKGNIRLPILTEKLSRNGVNMTNSTSYTITNINNVTVFNVTGKVVLLIVLNPHSYTSFLISLSVLLFNDNSINVSSQKIKVTKVKLSSTSVYILKLNIFKVILVVVMVKKGTLISYEIF